ncbi:glucosidase family protein [Pinibacter aurantiacus]|uniref:Glycosyl hydrolase 36 catalytic domain-containing protein n=1 Tax=Pinibacter aurantiacus TaxID=2851599 RepID=A0A9E2W125_9BACT|nr:hypothetical protein [Pinibacter aurantiacus]MBV4355635.1 hypothetical protein [Pinibacter aurantiacus]
MVKRIFAIIGIVSAVACSTNKKAIDQQLATTIRNDQRLQTVSAKAETLLHDGLNAGSGYGEIWIRDLNTFIELACKTGDVKKIREALLTFFKFQREDGNIVDGYIPKGTSQISYDFIYSPLAPDFAAHKNTVETDQESSLIQAINKYINVTHDTSLLNEVVAGRTVAQRMEDAMNFLLTKRYSEKYGLIWGGTTIDWGDVQPEHEWGVVLDSSSHPAIDIYDNAMFVIAMNNYVAMISDANKKKQWLQTRDQLSKNIRTYLWDASKQKFIPHVYLKGSPFPASFDENAIYYHGGTAIAIEAGLLSEKEILASYKQMQQNVKEAGAPSIGLTVHPVYPKGLFKNTWLVPYYYQNGGDWPWFGGRMVQQLIANGYYKEAYEALSPMLDMIIKNGGFSEWYDLKGAPNGSGQFRGSAGALWKAIAIMNEKM